MIEERDVEINAPASVESVLLGVANQVGMRMIWRCRVAYWGSEQDVFRLSHIHPR